MFFNSEISAQGHLMSGHQVRSSDPTYKNICDWAVTTVLQGSTWSFQQLIRASVPTKRIFRNFDFLDLRSGQLSDQTIKGSGKIFKCFLFRKHEEDHANHLKIVSCQATLNDPYIGLTPWLLRVIRGHKRSIGVLPITFDKVEIE